MKTKIHTYKFMLETILNVESTFLDKVKNLYIYELLSPPTMYPDYYKCAVEESELGTHRLILIRNQESDVQPLVFIPFSIATAN